PGPPLKPPGPSGEGVEGDPEKTLTFVPGGTETPTEEVPETYTTGNRTDGQLLLAPKISPKARKAFRILSATSTGSSPAACSSCVVLRTTDIATAATNWGRSSSTPAPRRSATALPRHTSTSWNRASSPGNSWGSRSMS